MCTYNGNVELSRVVNGWNTVVTIALTTLLIIATLPARAEGIQAITGIRSAILQFVAQQRPYGNPLQVQIGKIDPRLRLSPCTAPLNAFYPASANRYGNTTIGVECNDSSPWKVYIPVTLSVTAPMIVNTRAVTRGAILQAEDLQVVNRDITYLQEGFYSEPSQVIGMVAARPLRQGTVLTPKNLQPRVQVRRGDIVNILAETAGIQVYVKGYALMDGQQGQEIRVKNQTTQREIQAEVVGPGQVQVKM